MTNLSQWFQLSEQTPWEVGVYQVEYATGSIGHSYFDGKNFKNGWVIGSAQDQIKDAYDDRHIQETGKVVKWRGLSTNPEVKKKRENKRKQYVVVMEASGEELQRQHPVGVFEDEIMPMRS